MNTEMLPVDEKLMEDYFNNDYSYASTIFKMVADTVLPEMQDIVNNAGKLSAEEVRRTVHRLKPSFKMIGMIDLFNQLSKIEELCLMNADISGINSNLDLLKPILENNNVILHKQILYLQHKIHQTT
jgi:hypothetical protein